MSTGIRAKVSIDSPSECPISSVTGATGTSSYSISKSVSPTSDDGTVTEEFMLDDDVDPETAGLEGLQTVFSYDDKTVFRFSREQGSGCPCELVEAVSCPVIDIHSRDGRLCISFHAADMEELSDALLSLRDNYPSLSVEQLLRSSAEHQEQDMTFVDRSTLTERQREVLQTAHGMGYFEHPKGANAGEVADELSISPSTFSEHISMGQKKLLNDIIEA